MTEVAELYFLVRFTASLISAEASLLYYYRGTCNKPEKCSDMRIKTAQIRINSEFEV